MPIDRQQKAHLPPGMTRTVYLARHAETEWNRLGRWQGHTDIALSDAGRVQARELAARLAGLGICRIFSSDLARAKETAEIVARRLDVSGLVLDPGLRERGLGLFEGLTRAECATRFPDEWASYQTDPTSIPPGGEPYIAVIARMQDAIRGAATSESTSRADGPPILFVSHGGSMRALLACTTKRTHPPIGNVGLFRLFVQTSGMIANAEPVA
jgi:broad specificity phosphatase PhoE